MAENIIPQTQIRFTTVRSLYQFVPAVTVTDLEDQLSAKQSHLLAMLSVVSESSTNVIATSSMSNYLWACRVTAEEIKDLTAELLRRKEQPQH